MLKALLRLFRSSGDDDAEPARETIESETAEEAAVEHLGGFDPSSLVDDPDPRG